MKKNYLKVGNIVAFAAVIFFNVLAAIGVLGGVTTREVSYMYKSLLTPADYAFSIWSVIYILVAILVVRQVKNSDLRERMGNWFIFSCALNVAWIFAWQFQKIGLSFALITLLLVSLLVLMRSMKDSDVLSLMAAGLYTGWINVAMLANLGALFSYNDWHLIGNNPVADAMIGLAFGLLWICFFISAYSNSYYAIGASWGFVCIALVSDYAGIQFMAIAGVLVFVGITIWKIMKKNIDVTPMY